MSALFATGGFLIGFGCSRGVADGPAVGVLAAGVLCIACASINWEKFRL
jgi:hypothetical protein